MVEKTIWRCVYIPLTAHSSQLLSWTLAFAAGESTNEQGSTGASVRILGVIESSMSCGDTSNDVLDAIRPHRVTLSMLVKIKGTAAHRPYQQTKGSA